MGIVCRVDHEILDSLDKCFDMKPSNFKVDRHNRL